MQRFFTLPLWGLIHKNSLITSDFSKPVAGLEWLIFGYLHGEEAFNFLLFCWYFKYWSYFMWLCAIVESFQFMWSVVPYLLSLVQFFLSLPWKYFCSGWLIQEVWVHWGSAITHCFLHLKAGINNTSSFCLVNYCWDCWDFLTGPGVLFCQSAARNIFFSYIWSYFGHHHPFWSSLLVSFTVFCCKS